MAAVQVALGGGDILDRIIQDLRQIAVIYPREIMKGINLEILPRVRSRLPIRTGQLRASVQMFPDGSGLTAYIEYNFYGATLRPSVPDVIEQEIERGIEAVANAAWGRTLQQLGL